ncbi:MAG: hypothetical protein FGM57_00720 [Candidatus Taylorbacteria bacterium]|nr:hypothetical protein [Candidatus Taylorbacteria bacterium]
MSKNITFTSIETANKQIPGIRAAFSGAGLQVHPVLYKKTDGGFGVVALNPGEMRGYSVLEGNTLSSTVVSVTYDPNGTLVAI